MIYYSQADTKSDSKIIQSKTRPIIIIGSEHTLDANCPVENNPNLCQKYSMLKYIGKAKAFQPCYSNSCNNQRCRAKWSMKQFNILRESFLTLSPDYFVTVTFFNLPKYQELQSSMKKIHRLMKRQDPTYQYYSQIERSEIEENTHVHLLIRSKLSSSSIRQNIKKSMSCKTTVQVKSCYDPAGVAKYITKNYEDCAGVKIPFGYSGQGRRLTNCSKGFLSDSKERLWDQSKQFFTDKSEAKLVEMEKKLGGAMAATVPAVPCEQLSFLAPRGLRATNSRWAIELPKANNLTQLVPMAFPTTCRRNKSRLSTAPLDWGNSGISQARHHEPLPYPQPKLPNTKDFAGWKKFESERSNRHLPNSLW